MIELPTPYIINTFHKDDVHMHTALFTEGQMLQFRRDALEEALQCYSQEDTASDYIGKILDLKDET